MVEGLTVAQSQKAVEAMHGCYLVAIVDDGAFAGEILEVLKRYRLDCSVTALARCSWLRMRELRAET